MFLVKVCLSEETGALALRMKERERKAKLCEESRVCLAQGRNQSCVRHLKIKISCGPDKLKTA